MYFKRIIKKLPKAMFLAVGGLSFTYIGWKHYDFQTLNQTKNTSSDQTIQDTNQDQKKQKNNQKQEFLDELLQTMNNDLSKSDKQISYIQQFKGDIKDNDALIVLTFTLVREYKNLIEFLKQFKQNNQDKNIYLAFIESYEDLKKLEQQTNRQIISDDQKLNFFSFYNNIFESVQYLTASSIYNNNVFKKMKLPKKIQDNKELNTQIDELQSDEFLIVISQNNEEMKQLIYNKDYINFNKAKIVYKDLPDNEIQMYLKNKNDNNSIIKIQNEVSQDHNSLLKNINKQIKQQIGFDQKFFNYEDDDEQFVITFKIDNNIVPKVLRQYIDNNIKKVKQKLGDDSNKFKFIQINTKHHNSQKNWINVKAIDIKKYEQKVQFKYRNQDKKQLENYLKNNRKEWEALSLYHVPKFQQFSEEEIYNFCKSILEGKAEYDNFSQKAFNKKFYSNKITADTFQKDIIENDSNQALFVHSNHCHGCKKFLPVYEKFALKNLQNKTIDLNFNRINNDYNHNHNKPYHWTTPKIQIYRADYKEIPFEYRHAYLNEKLLKDFLTITTKFKIINWSIFDNMKSLDEYKVQINLQIKLNLTNGKQTKIKQTSL